MNAPQIQVRIEELVIDDISRSDRLLIGPALELELERLLVERGLPARLLACTDREYVDAGSFMKRPLATPSTMGGEVARAIHRGLDW